MFYALVNTLDYSKWCMKKEESGTIYIYNEFMKEFLSTEGSSALRWNVPSDEQVGYVTVNHTANWLENSWIAVKKGWGVKYNFKGIM